MAAIALPTAGGSLADLASGSKAQERAFPRLAWAAPPILLAVYPSLSLLAANLREATLADVVRPAAVSAALGLIAYLGALLLLRHPWKACLVSCLAVTLFFCYGPVYTPLKAVDLWGTPLGRHRLLLPAFAAAFAVVGWRVGRSTSSGRRVFPVLALISTAAVLPSSVSILLHALPTSRQTPAPFVSASADPVLHVASSERAARPDIYFIILDAHAREDVVHNYFGDADYNFPETLRAMGFVVADEATSNYLRTLLSVSATLNMNYLDDLPVDLRDPDYSKPLTDALDHSRVRSMLESIGYQTVATTSSFPPTEITDADAYLVPELSGVEALEARWAFTDFEEVLLRQTVLVSLVDWQTQRGMTVASFVGNGLAQARAIRRQVVLSALAHLRQSAAIRGPKLVFIHIVSPHYPYLFGAQGEPVDYPNPDTFAEKQVLPQDVTWPRYRDQMRFLDAEVTRAVAQLLRESAVEPVIVIQSDHGPATGFDRYAPTPLALANRNAILSAAYLPEACRSDYDSRISSVNTFRVVLNCLFRAGLPRLPDRAYLDFDVGEGLTLIPLEDAVP